MSINTNTRIQQISRKAIQIICSIVTIGTFWLCVFLLYLYVWYAAFLYGKFIFFKNDFHCFSPQQVHVWFGLFILAAWLLIWSLKHQPKNLFLKYLNYGWGVGLILISLGVFMNEIETFGKYYEITFGNMLFSKGGDYLLYVWCIVGISMVHLPGKMRRYVVVLHTFISTVIGVQIVGRIL